MKCSDKKKVFIKPSNSILDINPPIINNCIRELTIAQISHCIHQNATIFEILSDGSSVKLDYYNFNKDNGSNVIKKPNNVKPKKVNDITGKEEDKTENIVSQTVEENSTNDEQKEVTPHMSNKEKRRQDRERRRLAAAEAAAKKMEETNPDENVVSEDQTNEFENDKKETEVTDK